MAAVGLPAALPAHVEARGGSHYSYGGHGRSHRGGGGGTFLLILVVGVVLWWLFKRR